MSRIVKSIREPAIKRRAKRRKGKGVVAPTFKPVRGSPLMPDAVWGLCKDLGFRGVHSVSLFRIKVK